MTTSNNNNKLTYVAALNAAISCDALSQEVREKLEALRAQQEKRNNADKKPTKVQQENENSKLVILEVLAALDKAVTVSDLQAADSRLASPAMSNQKASALLRALKDEGKVEKVVEGRKSLFRLVEEEEAEM